jgi:hypothetical protein
MTTGDTVLLRKPDLYSLIDPSGKVSDPLTNMLMASLGGKVDVDVKSISDPKKFPDMMGMLDRIAVATFVEPKLTLDETGDDDHIPVRFVPLADKTFVMNWAMGAINEVKSFRPKSGGDVDAVPEGEGIQPEPVG